MRSSYATSNVTTLFWPRQDGPQFKAQPVDCEQLKKSVFSYRIPSKDQTLLLSKNRTHGNFGSVVL